MTITEEDLLELSRISEEGMKKRIRIEILKMQSGLLNSIRRDYQYDKNVIAYNTLKAVMEVVDEV